MPSIGGFNFITLQGHIAPFGTILEPFTRPGINGTGYRDMGKRGSVTTLVSLIDLATHAAAASTLQLYKNLEGNFVTVVIDLGGVAYNNVVVLNVEQQKAQAITTSAGGLLSNPQSVLRCAWQVQWT